MKKMRTIEAGEFLIVSSGCYSDYSISFLAKAKTNLDPDALKEAYFKDHASYDASDLMRWLSKKDLIEEIEYTEINTCNMFNDNDTMEKTWPTI